MNVAGSRGRPWIKHAPCKKGAFLRQTEGAAVALQPYSSPALMLASLSMCLYEAWLQNGSASSSFCKQPCSFTKYSFYCAARGAPRHGLLATVISGLEVQFPHVLNLSADWQATRWAPPSPSDCLLMCKSAFNCFYTAYLTRVTREHKSC